jgi:hypothetical protein
VTDQVWTPQRAANRLVKISALFAQAHGLDRFPVDVAALALEAAKIFGYADPIIEVKAANIEHLDGTLVPLNGRTEWLLLYGDAVTSPGRIRFTQAHELGHYILHRLRPNTPRCSSEDMLNWSQDEHDIEAQADLFASYLLMPLDDFRKQIPGSIDFNVLGQCADRYGVSLTAATLKWLQYTDELAVLVMSNDGYINWAWSSEPAFKAGAFFRTKNNVIPLPSASVAADTSVEDDRKGTEVDASVWFPHTVPKLTLREMKVHASRYDAVVTLLRLPRGADVWPPRDNDKYEGRR